MKKIIGVTALAVSLFVSPHVSEAANKAFQDVPTTHPSYEAITWTANQGIVSGSNGKFNPGGTLTEKQFVKMYAEFFKFPTSPNEPKNSSDWSDAYYERLATFNAPVQGTSNKTLRNQPLTRGTLAQLIAFAHGQPADPVSATKYLMKEGISSGQNLQETDPLKRFGAANTLTRAQAATFLFRMSQNGQNQIAPAVLKNKNLSTTATVSNAKSYEIGGNVQYRIEKENYKDYEISIYTGNKKIGGYITKPGTTFEGYTIGNVVQDSVVIKDGKQLHLLKDSHNGGKLYAIYWENVEDYQTFENTRYDTSATKYANLELLMVEVTNAFRAQHGLAALAYDEPVARVAKAHSTDMQKNNYFDHFDKKGNGPQQRVDAAKLNWLAFGENLARSKESTKATIFHANDGLINSKLHRANILDKNFKKAGVGIAGTPITGIYYTMNFITY